MLLAKGVSADLGKGWDIGREKEEVRRGEEQ